MEDKIYTILEITQYIKKLLSRDKVLKDVWITGEISNFHHHSSGHMYFTLKDKQACLPAIMFKSHNRNLKFEPEEGLKVTVHGYINVYVPRGTYQFYVDKIEPEGKGALFLAFKQLKEKLAKEGLFNPETKKEIPLLPQKIGVITSPTGAAIRDILSVAKRRFNDVSLLIVPSPVQGNQAADGIVAALEYLNQKKEVDLIIVSRGGGSLEDLWTFNEERVARAIFESRIPVISGVGHETDFTITDFVADLRAPTPSAAAEQAVVKRRELVNNLDNFKKRLVNTFTNQLKNYRDQLQTIGARRIFNYPQELFAEQLQKMDYLSQQLKWNMETIMNNCQKQYEILNEKLDTLSPLKTLKRGYSISSDKQGNIIKKIAGVKPGLMVETRVVDGSFFSEVKEVRESNVEVQDI